VEVVDMKRNEITAWLLTTPYLIYTAIFFVIPFVWAFYLSLTDWNLISPKYAFVGLNNFLDLFKNERVRAAFWVTYKFMIIYVPSVLVSSLSAALIVNALPKFKNIFLIGYFLPYLSSSVAISIVVKGILSYNSPFNTWLRTKGIEINWLNHEILTPLVIVIMILWKFTGYYALIIVSGLESIPKEVYEAAMIDGVTPWKSFWEITLPLLYPAFFTVTILSVGVMFHIFAEPYVLTSGGPNLATNTWHLEIYNEAFVKLRAGYGSAIAIAESVVTIISIFVIRIGLERWGKQYGW
jgi:multiple sugar transport system permease protein